MTNDAEDMQEMLSDAENDFHYESAKLWTSSPTTDKATDYKIVRNGEGKITVIMDNARFHSAKESVGELTEKWKSSN